MWGTRVVSRYQLVDSSVVSETAKSTAGISLTYRSTSAPFTGVEKVSWTPPVGQASPEAHFTSAILSRV